jgi:hypothetical protein
MGRRDPKLVLAFTGPSISIQINWIEGGGRMSTSSLPDKRVFRNIGLVPPGGGRVPAAPAPEIWAAPRFCSAAGSTTSCESILPGRLRRPPRTRTATAWPAIGHRPARPRNGFCDSSRPFAGPTRGRARGPAPKRGVDRFAEMCVISIQMNCPPAARGEARGGGTAPAPRADRRARRTGTRAGRPRGRQGDGPRR